LRATLWAPRCTWCDSKVFYDTDDVKQKRFSLDWQAALDQLGLAKIILRADTDGDGLAEEVEEVGAVLWESAERIFLIFSYYSALGDDIFGLSLNEWTQFVDDHKINNKKSKFCKKADLDRLFIQIDTTSSFYWQKLRREIEELSMKGALRDKETGAKISVQKALGGDAADKQNKAKALSRVEFLGALVHVALYKYINNGEVKDVSEAVQRLLTRDIRPHPTVIMDPDKFRREYCYTEGVTRALARREASLRCIFAGVSGGGRTGAAAQLISLSEWTAFLEAIGFIGADLTLRDACFAFVWSRMGVVNGREGRGYLRESGLPFEGFLEVLCRISVLKAVPTDEEIEAAGQSNAGTYLAWLKVEDEDGYATLVRTRGTPWGTDPSNKVVARCVHHMLAMMIYAIEGETAGTDDLNVTEKEVTDFLKKFDLFGNFEGAKK